MNAPNRATEFAAVGRRESSSAPRRALALRRVLFATDTVAAAVAWSMALAMPLPVLGAVGLGRIATFELAAILTAATAGFVAAMGLYRARTCGLRADEVRRLAHAAALAALVSLPVARAFGADLPVRRALLAALVAFALLAIGRDLFAHWLRSVRVLGAHQGGVLLVGTGADARALVEHFRAHPEAGLEVRGVVGRPVDAAALPSGVALLGPAEAAVEIAEAVGASSIVIAAGALPSAEAGTLVRQILGAGLQVRLAPGIAGIDPGRLSATSVAREPLLVIEPARLARWQEWTKRAFDLVLGAVLVLLTAPVLAASAAAIKLGDRGPVFFRQTRVGRGGREFEVLKLRTMVPDADARRSELEGDNERTGPLFKLKHDPRRTRVGRILEATSIDELPQLLNVLRGEMSLVGPRPARPHEVEQFDEDLLRRHDVTPGVTGLWQVEARDDPRFGEYRRLDLFYVDNWSIALDLAILLGTARSVFVRLFAR